MTDREKLLVALLAEPDDAPAGGVGTIELMAMLAELGADYRAMWRELAVGADATV